MWTQNRRCRTIRITLPVKRFSPMCPLSPSPLPLQSVFCLTQIDRQKSAFAVYEVYDESSTLDSSTVRLGKSLVNAFLIVGVLAGTSVSLKNDTYVEIHYRSSKDFIVTSYHIESNSFMSFSGIGEKSFQRAHLIYYPLNSRSFVCDLMCEREK